MSSSIAKTPIKSTSAASPASSNKVLCLCKKPAVKFQVKKEGRNNGRWFYRCYNTINHYIEGAGTTCNFYKWEDDLETDLTKSPAASADSASASRSMINDPLTPPDNNQGYRHQPQKREQIYSYRPLNNNDKKQTPQHQHDYCCRSSYHHQEFPPHHPPEYSQAEYSRQEQKLQHTRREDEEFWTTAPEGSTNNLFKQNSSSAHTYENDSTTTNESIPPSPSPAPDPIRTLKERLAREERRARAFEQSAKYKANLLAETKARLESIENENDMLKSRLETTENENKNLKRKLEESEPLEEENRYLKRRLLELKGKESTSLSSPTLTSEDTYQDGQEEAKIRKLMEEIEVLKNHHERNVKTLNEKIQLYEEKCKFQESQIDRLRQQHLAAPNVADFEKSREENELLAAGLKRLREENEFLVREKRLISREQELLKQENEELKRKLETEGLK